MIKRALVAFFLLTLFGCSASGPKFKEIDVFSEQTSTLYIFRKSALVNSAYCPALRLDSVAIKCLRNGGFIRREMRPGEHTLSVRKRAMESGPQPRLKFSSKPGEVVYIEWTSNVRNLVPTPYFISVSYSEALIKTEEKAAIDALLKLSES